MCGDVHNGPTSKTGPQRSSHSAPLLPQVLVSSQPHSFPPSRNPGSEKGLDQVFLWVGMEERGKPLSAARGWQHERPYSSQEHCKAYGSVWPPRRKGYWVGLYRLQAEPQDPEVADLMGFPCPTRQRWCRCSKCWRITVAWIMGMIVKHMRNHNLGDLCSATCPPYTPHRILPGSGRRELQVRNWVSLFLPGRAVSDWEEKNPHTPGWGLRILCITQSLKEYENIIIMPRNVCNMLWQKDRIQKYMEVW